MKRIVAMGALLLAASSCGGGDDDPGPSPYVLDDVLRLNHVQAKGTHNSYHLEPENPPDDSLRYSHVPLDEQLELHGVRQFELDLHYREDVGFEVFHIPIMDEETTCKAFTDCLGLIEDWSAENPWHLPIMIWLEPKDEADILDETLIEFFDRYDELEQEILSVFPRRRVLTPDEVRGDHPDLPTAIATTGWPTLGELRGRVMFSLLDSELHREAYLGDALDLQGRLLFVAADDATDPFAAMFKINDAQAESARVQELVQAGFIITSNVDGCGNPATENATKLADSLAAGFHYGSSDFPAPVDGYDFWFDLPDGAPARCNPVYPAAQCASTDIENLDEAL